MSNEIQHIDRSTAIALQEKARELFMKATSLGFVEPQHVGPDERGKNGIWYRNEAVHVAARFFGGGSGFVLGVFGGEDSGRIVLTIEDTVELLEEGPDGSESRLTGELAVPFAEQLIETARCRFFPPEE